MRKKIIAVILLCMCILVSCQKDPEEVLRENGTDIVMVETEYLERSEQDKESIDSQLTIIADKLNREEESVDDDSDEVTQFAVTDMDYNGRLELIVSSCGGTGIYTRSTFYEMNETFDELVECPTDFVEGDSQADIMSVVIPAYWDEEEDIYYYVFEDLLKNGATEYYENTRALTLKDGKIAQKYIAYKTTIYVDSTPDITYKDMNGETITEEEYRTMADNMFAGMRKYLYAIGWFDECDLHGLPRDMEIELLRDSYEGFFGDEEHPPIVLGEENLAYLENICTAIPTFQNEEEMDADFWGTLVYQLYVDDTDGEIEERYRYGEKFGTTATYRKVSLEEVDDRAEELFGRKLSDYVSPDEAVSGMPVNILYEDGYFYICISEVPVGSVELILEDRYNGMTDVRFELKNEDSRVSKYEIGMFLLPANNEHGFIIGCLYHNNIETSAITSEDEKRRQAFGKVLWDAYQRGILPDGSELDYRGMEAASNNGFALSDIDCDGQEELLLYWDYASMAGTVGVVFGYDDGAVHMELRKFPMLIFYDNGIVEVGWSHNQGSAGEFWPYDVLLYDAENDVYQAYGSVDAWDKRVREENYKGDSFPTDIDADGDGIVYYIFPANWDGQYDDTLLVDGSDYENWRNAYLDGAEEINISFQKLTEENIAALGYPKPDIVLPQPVG